MEINYKKKEYIIFPQIACILSIVCYISIAFIYRKNYLYAFFYIPYINFILIFYFINKGIINKNYNNFNIGVMISWIFAISSFLFKFGYYFFAIILILFLMGLGNGDDDDEVRYRNSDDDDYLLFNELTFIMLITSVIDSILAAVLICYKNKIKKYCERQQYDQNEFTNFPLIKY